MAEYKLSHTAQEIDQALTKVKGGVCLPWVHISYETMVELAEAGGSDIRPPGSMEPVLEYASVNELPILINLANRQGTFVVNCGTGDDGSYFLDTEYYSMRLFKSYQGDKGVWSGNLKLKEEVTSNE